MYLLKSFKYKPRVVYNEAEGGVSIGRDFADTLVKEPTGEESGGMVSCFFQSGVDELFALCMPSC